MKKEKYEKAILVEDFLKDYVDVPKFQKLCAQCEEYNKRWSCPNFDFDPLDYWRQFKWLKLYATKLYLTKEEEEDFRRVLRYAKEEIAEELYAQERNLPGSRALNAGSCTFCGNVPCAKALGEPCRFPDRLRYSVESLGGNVTKTSEELLGIKIYWEKDKKFPPYFVLIGGILY